MAGWCPDSDDDDELLNLNLFARKSFGFQGFSQEKENTLKNIVKHFGATCDNYPKYVFTSVEYYNSLINRSIPLYNVAFFRDCVDANRYLNIEQYRFGGKHQEKKEFRDFDPCCANFHNGQEACIVCDPDFQPEDRIVKGKNRLSKKNVKDKARETDQSKRIQTKKKIRLSNLCTIPYCTVSSDPHEKHPRKKTVWEPWECRLILDYIICNEQFFWVKSPSLYRRIFSEGFLTHRTPESMRVYFRTNILKCIESYDLPEYALKKLQRIRKADKPSRIGRRLALLRKKKLLKRNKEREKLKKKLKMSEKKL